MEKKIEEMIHEMAHCLCGQKNCAECPSDYRCEFITMSSILIKAGYRKQGEIIDEFAELIKKDFTDYPEPISWLEITEEGFCKRIDELVAEMKGGAE